MKQFLDHIHMMDIKNIIFCVRNDITIKNGFLTSLDTNSRLYKTIYSSAVSAINYENVLGIKLEDITLDNLLFNTVEYQFKLTLLPNNIIFRYFNIELCKDLASLRNCSEATIKGRYPLLDDKKLNYLANYLDMKSVQELDEIYVNRYLDTKFIVYNSKKFYKLDAIDVDKSIEFCNDAIDIMKQPTYNDIAFKNLYKNTYNIFPKKNIMSEIEAAYSKYRQFYLDSQKHLSSIKNSGEYTKINGTIMNVNYITENIPFVYPHIKLTQGVLKSDKYKYSNGRIVEVN